MPVNLVGKTEAELLRDDVVPSLTWAIETLQGGQGVRGREWQRKVSNWRTCCRLETLDDAMDWEYSKASAL